MVNSAVPPDPGRFAPRANHPLPPTCAVAFKEWAGVCSALMTGRQSLILRKGGVSETDGEFRPDHPAFWLYPTVVHQAEQGLRTPGDLPPADADADADSRLVAIEALAVVTWAGRVERPDQLDALAAFHDWTAETIRGRFDYRRPGLWALVVATYRRPDPWPLLVTPEQLGCKTWVPLDPGISTAGLHPVLDPALGLRRLAAIRQALEIPA